MNKKIGNILLACSILILCLVILEVALRVFAPISDPYADRKYNTTNRLIRSDYPPYFKIVTEMEPGLPGMSGLHTFSTNNVGFRGDDLMLPKPKDEFRVFIVGGSTTESYYNDDSKVFTRVLQDQLSQKYSDKQVKVYNTGRAGDRIDAHVAMISQRLVHMQPDLIIVFTGLNDLVGNNFNFSYDPLHLTKYDKISSFIVFRIFTTEFQIPRYMYKIAASFDPILKTKAVFENVPNLTNVRERVELRKSQPITVKKPVAITNYYKVDLTTIVGLAKAHNFKLAFMTQASTWNSKVDPSAENWHWRTNRNGINYREDELDGILNQYNQTMRDVGRDNSIPVFDTYNVIPKSLKYFFDDFYFNVEGSKKVGQDLADFVLENKLVN